MMEEYLLNNQISDLLMGFLYRMKCSKTISLRCRDISEEIVHISIRK
ncbi:Uncharacterized protein BM_BM1348 [Brugia malayi]|uniref:Bm1348 n=1 Tax=Brugia malayi TaxID=6279 RepID=A0A1U7F164_BRUMA|nr:Uncharacterized protein BM_BM1348 [Brugia malayi]CDP96494.1 Bm1348 [Brugia malayi]VIO98228.1 Uncharacterized protein BM_BM1348 [Brugia malayi]